MLVIHLCRCGWQNLETPISATEIMMFVQNYLDPTASRQSSCNKKQVVADQDNCNQVAAKAMTHLEQV